MTLAPMTIQPRGATALLCTGAILLALGCSSGKAEQPAAGTTTSAVEATAVKSSKPVRSGLGAPVVWRAKERPSNQGMCSRTYDIFEVIEIRADDSSLYLDLFHEGATEEKDHSGVVPKILLLADGCPVRKAPVASGEVLRDSVEPTTTVLPLADLPDGDLDLFLYAFGSEYVVVLNKQGSHVRRITGKERKGAQVYPADERLGIPASIVVPQPTCPGEVAL